MESLAVLVPYIYLKGDVYRELFVHQGTCFESNMIERVFRARQIQT